MRVTFGLSVGIVGGSSLDLALARRPTWMVRPRSTHEPGKGEPSFLGPVALKCCLGRRRGLCTGQLMRITMTQDKNRKLKIRALADKTGMSYTAARHARLARKASPAPPPRTAAPVREAWMNPTNLVPAASLDYLRALSLARQAYGLLVNTSELAWRIYGVSSPQGRDGDQILNKSQYLKNMLRSDAFDLWVVHPSDKEEDAVEDVFRGFYPPVTGIMAELGEEARLRYRGRGSRGRYPKAMPAEAHQAVAQAHYEAKNALSQLEALLAPHHQHPGTRLRLNTCRRLVELAARQRAAFRAAWKAEHRNEWKVVPVPLPAQPHSLNIRATLETSAGQYVAEALAFLRDTNYSPADFGYTECRPEQLLFLNRIEPYSPDDPPGGESACVERMIAEAESRRRHLVCQVDAKLGDNERLAMFLQRFGFERVEPPHFSGILLMRRHSASLRAR